MPFNTSNIPLSIANIRLAIRVGQVIKYKQNAGAIGYTRVRIYDTRALPECVAKFNSVRVGVPIVAQVLIDYLGSAMWINVGADDIEETAQVIPVDKKHKWFVYEYLEDHRDPFYVGKRFITNEYSDVKDGTYCIASSDDYDKLKFFIDASPEAMRAWLENNHKNNPKAFPKPTESIVRMVCENYDKQLKSYFTFPFNVNPK